MNSARLAYIWFYAFMPTMRTTLDLPDDLYALVKAKAALEGRTLRSVVEELLKGWVKSQPGTAGDREPQSAVGEPGLGYGKGAKPRTRTAAGTASETRGRARSGQGLPASAGEAGAPARTDVADPLDSHREDLRNIMRHPKSLDELGELLAGPGPDMELSTMRELYQLRLAEEWKRRHP